MIPEAGKLIQEAENALQVAKGLLSNRHYPDSVSKACYIMFYCVSYSHKKLLPDASFLIGGEDIT